MQSKKDDSVNLNLHKRYSSGPMSLQNSFIYIDMKMDLVELNAEKGARQNFLMCKNEKESCKGLLSILITVYQSACCRYGRISFSNFSCHENVTVNFFNITQKCSIYFCQTEIRTVDVLYCSEQPIFKYTLYYSDPPRSPPR